MSSPNLTAVKQIQKLFEDYLLNESEVEPKLKCMNCGSDFYESQNLEYSCRMHPQTYDGRGFWKCCSNKDKKSQGCRVQKHSNITIFEASDEDTCIIHEVDETKEEEIKSSHPSPKQKHTESIKDISIKAVIV